MESCLPQGSDTYPAGLSLGLRKESQLSRKAIPIEGHKVKSKGLFVFWLNVES